MLTVFRVVGRLKGRGRVGELTTPHGIVRTPVFMPVGTRGSVKGLDNNDLRGLGAEIILGNTYHLYLKPGEELVRVAGGLARFNGWDGPTLTDSGGFQVASLGRVARSATGGDSSGATRAISLSRIDDAGVEFVSYFDGSRHFFTPEKSIEIQQALGADIIMAFDECTLSGSRTYVEKAMERTHRWLVRSQLRWSQLEKLKKESEAKPQMLFGIIQGGGYRDLRRESARFVANLDLPGVALGGESIGSHSDETSETISWVEDLLPIDRPRYAMGVGVRPSDLTHAIEDGVDMFDCVAPTRLARCGLVYNAQAKDERIDLRKSLYARDFGVIDSECDCYTCRSAFSRAYLHHLLRCRELSYYRLASIHNLRTMVRTVQLARGEKV